MQIKTKKTEFHDIERDGFSILTEKKDERILVKCVRVKPNGKEDKMPLLFRGKILGDTVEGRFYFDPITVILLALCLVGTLMLMISAFVQSATLGGWLYALASMLIVGVYVRLYVKATEDKPKIIDYLRKK